LEDPTRMKSSRRLVFAGEAENDMELLLAHSLENWGAEQRDVYAERLLTAMHELRTYPHLGRERNDLQPGLRRHLAGQHAIYYFADADVVRIARVLHSKMDPARQLGSQ
jgi:toxin ParE1/3/4